MSIRLTRRRFVCGALVAGPVLLSGCGVVGLQAQQPTRIARVGFLAPESPTSITATLDEAFRDGLRELGYVDGQNVAIEWRYLEGRPERAADLASELVQLPVDILVVRGGFVSRAARDATSTIPIVMTMHEDPVGAGLVQSLARPGGNVTGLSTLGRPVSEKRLQLLKQTAPTISRVGVLWDSSDQSSVAIWQGTEVAALALGIQLQSLDIRSAEEFELVAEAVARERPDALIVSGGFLVNGVLTRRIAVLAAKYELPTISGSAGIVRAGGLMAYGPTSAFGHRRAAYFVDRILKGTKPADLPVEQPMTFDFVVNMKTAQALGITFPNEIMLQVTEVLQ